MDNPANEFFNKEQILLEYMLNRKMIPREVQTDVYQEHRERILSLFGDRMQEYDLGVRWGVFGDSHVKEYVQDGVEADKRITGQKKDPERRDPKRHFTVYAFPYPFICSPTFAVELGRQVLEQAGQILGVPNLPTLARTNYDIAPFYFSGYYYGNLDPSLQKLAVTENGICYTYFLCNLSIIHSCLWGYTREYFWVRYHSLLHPSEEIQPENDVAENEICFEICSEAPKAFPAWEDLPETVHRLREVRPSRHETQKDYEWLEDPNGWIPSLLERVKQVLQSNQEAAARAAERRARKKKEKEKHIPVDMAEVVYYPDVTFSLEFSHVVTAEEEEQVNQLMADYERSLELGLDFYAVNSTDEFCEITVDFGPNDPKVVEDLILRLEKSGLDIESILIS